MPTIAYTKRTFPSYKRVLEACLLTTDIATLPTGDDTNVGDGGCMVSGGQRARIALARALYSSAKLVVLDDVLATLDPVVSYIVNPDFHPVNPDFHAGGEPSFLPLNHVVSAEAEEDGDHVDQQEPADSPRALAGGGRRGKGGGRRHSCSDRQGSAASGSAVENGYKVSGFCVFEN